MQCDIEAIAIPQNFHRLIVDFVKPILRRRAVFMRGRGRSRPAEFPAEKPRGAVHLLADSHEIEGG